MRMEPTDVASRLCSLLHLSRPLFLHAQFPHYQALVRNLQNSTTIIRQLFKHPHVSSVHSSANPIVFLLLKALLPNPYRALSPAVHIRSSYLFLQHLPSPLPLSPTLPLACSSARTAIHDQKSPPSGPPSPHCEEPLSSTLAILWLILLLF